MGAEESAWWAGVVNPWAGSGEGGDADPLHPDWDEIVGGDVERLRSVTTELLGNTSNGLLLWIPLRRPEHLDRGAEGRQYGLGERCPRPEDLCARFGCSAPAALLLAQCGYLQTIGAERAAGPESLHDHVRLDWLLPVAAACGVRWKALDANSCPVLSIPQWGQQQFPLAGLVVACGGLEPLGWECSDRSGERSPRSVALC